MEYDDIKISFVLTISFFGVSSLFKQFLYIPFLLIKNHIFLIRDRKCLFKNYIVGSGQ